MEVLDNTTQEYIGIVSNILIHPDNGAIEGLFVASTSFMGFRQVFCSAHDIVSIGTIVTISCIDALCDPMDIIRLQPILKANTPVLGQRIVTESGDTLGVCRDIQFDTEAMKLQWLFPKRWFRWGAAIPAHSIMQITLESITVRDRELLVPDTEGFDPLPERV